MYCGSFCFIDECTGCSVPCFPDLVCNVAVILLIGCQVRYSVEIFTLLKLRQSHFFSAQGFQSFLKLDFSVPRLAATFLWLSLCEILCLSSLRRSSLENKFLFDFVMYFEAIVKDRQVLQTNTTKETWKIRFSQVKSKQFLKGECTVMGS